MKDNTDGGQRVFTELKNHIQSKGQSISSVDDKINSLSDTLKKDQTSDDEYYNTKLPELEAELKQLELDLLEL